MVILFENRVIVFNGLLLNLYGVCDNLKKYFNKVCVRMIIKYFINKIM